jgi:hypothetical protein
MLGRRWHWLPDESFPCEAAIGRRSRFSSEPAAPTMRRWMLTATDCSCASLNVCARFDADRIG